MTDELVDALHELSLAMHRNRERLDRAIEKTEELCKARSAGAAWADIVTREQGTLVISLIGENLEELYNAGGRVRRSLARSLYAEGLSMEQIARAFGVTRQRVSALLKSDGGGQSQRPVAETSSEADAGSARSEFVEDGERL